ncbi:MAG TPA: transferrin receptor-like dimerization domain-containing protein, partial [Gemmatimonadaceae bacterium]|nr:transferrin receptor-like dimerization domain-containing protein [Gemmatimonadaceae bacterium]
FRAVPSADSLRSLMRRLSEEPHEAGTDRSRRVAEAIVAYFRAAGLDARVERFEALMPRPVSRRLELVAPERYVARLAEPPVPGDKDSGDKDQLPTFNAYSADGDVTAPLVFVNYGIPEDYKVLDSLGIDVRGKIVIARYGRSWRGIKPKLAAERGAVGCLIYSDPEDDGYFAEDVYPKGPMRPEQGVQRGSIMDMPTHPGDPLTPGWGAEAGGRKLARGEAKTIVPIPTLPISYGDALPLLRNLGGPVAPESWRGALPITYHVGGGPAQVRLALQFDWQVRPLYNAVARIPGAAYPDEWVVWGNHHDAWVNGAADPISGMVAVMEAARAFGTLLQTGWRPARTIILAGWDGEEWGLLGSTEWAEKYKSDLRGKAVAYLNSDSNDRGWLSIGGSHSLQSFALEVARDVRDPKTGRSVLDRMLEHKREQDRGRDRAPSDSALRADTTGAARRDSTRRDLASTRPDTLLTLEALGSGSDFTPFIQHVGAPTLNLSFGGEQSTGVYHSIYDSFDFYTRFNDTTFAYGVALAQTAGTAVLRLADAPVLPFEFTNVARTFRGYVDELETGARKESKVGTLELADVRRALDRLGRAADRYERAYAAVAASASRAIAGRRRDVTTLNGQLLRSEQALTDEAGLGGREWYKHLIYAPGFYTGYGVKTMPGIREAIEDRPDAAVARREAARVAQALDRLAGRVEQAADALARAVPAPPGAVGSR